MVSHTAAHYRIVLLEQNTLLLPQLHNCIVIHKSTKNG